MKNTIITSVIIGSVFLNGNLFASGTDSRKSSSEQVQPQKELLKFSVNDFVTEEDESAGIVPEEILNNQNSGKTGGEDKEAAKETATEKSVQ